MPTYLRDEAGQYVDMARLTSLHIRRDHIIVEVTHTITDGTVHNVPAGLAIFGGIPAGRPLWTAGDYRPGLPRHNAQVFADIWHSDIHGIDDQGLFEAGEGSAGTIPFRSVVAAIEASDVHRKLTHDDAENAAAMVYHLTPDLAGPVSWKLP